jgi:hypothetical protein
MMENNDLVARVALGGDRYIGIVPANVIWGEKVNDKTMQIVQPTDSVVVKFTAYRGYEPEAVQVVAICRELRSAKVFMPEKKRRGPKRD